MFQNLIILFVKIIAAVTFFLSKLNYSNMQTLHVLHDRPKDTAVTTV